MVHKSAVVHLTLAVLSSFTSHTFAKIHGEYETSYTSSNGYGFPWDHWLDSPHQEQPFCGPRYGGRRCEAYDCCAVNGACGYDSRHCNVRSQKGYGWTPPEIYLPPPPPKLMARASSGMPCGTQFGNVSCQESECCSAIGVCGLGAGFCTAPGCQTDFGMCDAEIIPEGLDPSQGRPAAWGLPVTGKVIDRCTKPRTLALTYDDGPNKYTARILDLLEENNATATFFVAGITNDKGEIDITPEWIRDVKRMAVNGHQVASHTYSHPYLDKLTREGRMDEMYKNERAIANIVGSYPAYMRPPYSECSTFTETSCLSDMAELGYHVIGYEFDTADTESGSTLESMKAAIDRAFSRKPSDGNMLVIQHEHTRFAYEITEYLIEKAYTRDWKVETVADCLEEDQAFRMRVPLALSLNDKSQGGCHFATPGFCGTIQPFTDVKTCVDSALQCRRDARKCDQADCVFFNEMCRLTMEHCRECDEIEEGGLCDSTGWTMEGTWAESSREFMQEQ